MMNEEHDAFPGRTGLLATMFRHRFVILLGELIGLMLALAIVPLIAPGASPQLTAGIITGLCVAILLSAVFVVSKSRVTVIIAASLAAPAIILQTASLVSEQIHMRVVGSILAILFLSYVIALFLKMLFKCERVTLNAVCASLCIYLLLGMMWAFVYALVETLQPGSFEFAHAEEAGSDLIRFDNRFSFYPLYYSFGTMTTLGSGDVVPTTATARMFAIIEAVMGQLYIAVLVARLVGLHIVHSVTERREIC